MGLIRTISDTARGVVQDQWKEFFYCEAMPDEVLLTMGQKRTGRRSVNLQGSDNVISNGSIIAVADGQCMLIVDQGDVVEVCAEPGEFIFDTSAEPSIFAGDLSESVIGLFTNTARRFTLGNLAARDQRIYYINTREIVGNKYGTPNPIVFRVVDQKADFEIDLPVRCFGEYSFRITNPLLFYASLSGNTGSDYTRERITGQMRSELLTALSPALARISAMGISYSQLMGHTTDIRDALKAELSQLWGGCRGMEIVNFGISSLKGDEAVEAEMREMQREARYFNDPGRMAARLGNAQAEAMEAAAANPSAGPAMAFMGMNMASQAGGMNSASLYQMAAEQNQDRWDCACGRTGNTGSFCGGCGAPRPQPQPQSAPPEEPVSADSWICACGTRVQGNFCPQCGAPRPAPAPKETSWTCRCGAVNTGNFCAQCGTAKPAAPAVQGWTCPQCGRLNEGRFCPDCGTRKPAGVPLYRCDKCGWKPDDPAHPPRFCPQCGDPFGEEDIQ